MKVNPYGYYGLEIEAESDPERVWFQQFLDGFDEDFIKNAGTVITVEINRCSNHVNNEIGLSEAFCEEEGNMVCSDMVNKIIIHAGGL